MGVQEFTAYLIVAAAALWLAARWWRRRRAGTCCGEAECPAARASLERLVNDKQ